MVLFGEKLRHLRHQQGMTQVELTRLLDLRSHTHITKLEAGQRFPSLELVVRLANVYRVTTDYLLRDTIPVAAAENSSVIVEISFGSEVAGAKIRDLRLQGHISQVELARRLGLARQSHISNIEAGRKEPSPELVVKIADFFSTTTDYLLGRSPSQ